MQVSALEAPTISVNIFFGDPGQHQRGTNNSARGPNETPQSAYLSKLLRPPLLPAFSYWLLNIVEQSRHLESFQNVPGAPLDPGSFSGVGIDRLAM
jgi:hypothetical protein